MKQKAENPFQWFEDEFGRGCPILTIERDGNAFFVKWDGDTGRFDFRHFKAAFDSKRMDKILMGLFDSVRDTRLINGKSVLNCGSAFGEFYYISRELAELVFSIVRDEFNAALKLMAKVYRDNRVPPVGSTNHHEHTKLIGVICNLRGISANEDE